MDCFTDSEVRAIYDRSFAFNLFVGLLAASLTDSSVNNTFVNGQFYVKLLGEYNTSFGFLFG